MEFLFDLLLTAFFSLLFAFLLSKLFSPSTSSSSSSSGTASSTHDAADVISGEAPTTEQGLPEEVKASRLRGGEDLQEEKIIEMDTVVEKEVPRQFLVEEARSVITELGGIGFDKVVVCEETEVGTDGFATDVEVEKEKIDHGLVQQDESFELETSTSSDKEKELCASEVEDGKIAQSFDLTLVQDEDIICQEEESSREVELSEPGFQKDGTYNLCQVEGPVDKMPTEIEVLLQEESCLQEEHEFKRDSICSATVQEEVFCEAVVSREYEKVSVKVKDGEHNLSEVEGPLGETATEDGFHLKELTVPEEIPVLIREFSEEENVAEPILEFSEPEVQQDGIDNLCEVEGLIDKMPTKIEVPSQEESCCLKEEHEFKIGSPVLVTVLEEVSHEALVSREFEKPSEKAKAGEYNLLEVEGDIGKTATEDDYHLKELIVPEEIPVLVGEISEQQNVSEPILESSEQKKGGEQEKEENLSKVEGPTSKIAYLVEVLQKEEGKTSIEEEDWEGIERTDTEKQFAVAAGYATSVCGIDALAKVSNEVQLQLYGLHKVATEGPCYESHPLALRTSTRAKWHAWQKLGNMNPETAMEEYMNLLSNNVPNWSEQPIVAITHQESDQLIVESSSCIEDPTTFGSAFPEKGTE